MSQSAMKIREVGGRGGESGEVNLLEGLEVEQQAHHCGEWWGRLRMSFIWDRNTGKIGPARTKASLHTSYTPGELTTLAQKFLQQSPLTDKLTPELVLSSFLVWLAKREQGKELRDERDKSGVRM